MQPAFSWYATPSAQDTLNGAFSSTPFTGSNMYATFSWKVTSSTASHAHQCLQLYPSRGAPCSQLFSGRPRHHRQDTLKGVLRSTLRGELHAASLSLEGHATIVKTRSKVSSALPFAGSSM